MIFLIVKARSVAQIRRGKEKNVDDIERSIKI